MKHCKRVVCCNHSCCHTGPQEMILKAIPMEVMGQNSVIPLSTYINKFVYSAGTGTMSKACINKTDYSKTFSVHLETCSFYDGVEKKCEPSLYQPKLYIFM